MTVRTKRRKGRRRSKVARVKHHTKRRAKRHARRARRKGKMPAGLARYWAGKRAGKNPKRHRRASPKARMKRRRRKTHARGTKHRQGPHEFAHGRTVAVNPRRKRRRSRARAVKRRRSRRRVGVNPGVMSLSGGLAGFTRNLKDTFMHGGLKSILSAVAGAGGAVFAGTIMARTTTPLIASVLPGLITNPIFARVLGGANYYLAGWALAKYLPGLSPKMRRAILTGATAAAALEVAKPGIVRGTLAKLPIVGGVFGSTLQGIGDDMGAYVAGALSGSGQTDRYIGQDGTADYVQLNDYVDTDGMGDYVEISGGSGLPGMANY